MNDAHEVPFAALDFETATRAATSACAVGLAIARDGNSCEIHQQLIRPPERRFEFTPLHGIAWRDVRHAGAFSEVWPAFDAKLESVRFLAAHNASFDQAVLRACLAHYGMPDRDLPFVCTVKVARECWGIYPTKLPDVCRELCIPLNHHQAGADAAACAEIVRAALADGWRLPHHLSRRDSP